MLCPISDCSSLMFGFWPDLILDLIADSIFVSRLASCCS